MSKKNIYIIIAIALTVIGVVFFTLFNKPVSIQRSNTISAVPISTPLFFKLNNPQKLLLGTQKPEIANTLISVPQFAAIVKQLDTLKTIIDNNEHFMRLSKNKDIILTLNYSGKDQLNPMLLFGLSSNADNEAANSLISEVKNSPNAFTRKYNKVNIVESSFGKYNLSAAISKGVLIVSTKSMLIEEAIMQQDVAPINEEPELAQLMKTMSTQADINLFVNHQLSERALKKLTSAQLKNHPFINASYAKWTELDINISSDKIIAGGFTYGNNSENYFSNILQKQESHASQIDKVLPAGSAFFVSLSLSDPLNYFSNYEEYLTKRNQIYQRKDALLKIEKTCGFELVQLLLDQMKNETAIASVLPNVQNPQSGRVWIIEAKSGSTAMAKLIELQLNYIKGIGQTEAEWQKYYEVDSQTGFTIYRFPYPNAAQLLFGNIFDGIESNWFAQYNNHIIFGDSYRTVARTLHANLLGETLAASTDFNLQKNNFNARSNITVYINPAAALPISSTIFNKTLAEQIFENDQLRKFKSVGWQISSTGDMLYNNIFATHNTEIKSKPQTVWQSHIESNFNFKPKFVSNHTDPLNKEVVLQDQNNVFYLINHIGRVLWQIQLDGPILGEIHQIDLFRNGKLQYLLNTANKLYLIDRNGNSISNFPVNFRTQATNGVAVFDYDNNKDYRFFVACSDHNIYAYSTNGNLLDGWDIFKTDHEVTQTLQHFRVEGKDYIVASDNMKDYILHRKGTIRVPTSEVYPHSANNTIFLEERTNNHEPRLVTTDTKGNLHYTYLDGKHQVVNHNITLSENHWLNVADIDNNNEYDYIIADSETLVVIDAKGKSILKKRFDHNISHRPNIYTFSRNSKKIGITTSAANKIYLFDSTGSLHPGFPLAGSTEFSIGFLSSELSNFNLLVGSSDGYLYNYYVE